MKGILIGVLIGLLGLFMGWQLVFVSAVQTDALHNRLAGLPTSPAVVLDTFERDVLLTGTLAENPVLSSDNYRINQIVQELELVAYSVDTWQVEYKSGTNDNDHPYQGSWEPLQNVVPDLQLNYADSVVTMVAAGVSLDGHVTGEIWTKPVASEWCYDDEGGSYLCYKIKYTENSEGKRGEGSLYVHGWRSGDMLSVVGVRHADGTLTPKRLFGGTRTELLASVTAQADSQRTGGYIMLVIGSIAWLYVLFAILGKLGIISPSQPKLSQQELLARSR